MSRKFAKACGGCQETRLARFRVAPDRYLCDDCDQAWRQTGVIPGPAMSAAADGAPSVLVTPVMQEILEDEVPTFEIPADVRAAMVKAGALR